MTAEKSRKIDADMENSLSALVRASKKARLIAAQTQTEFVVIRDGKLVREVPTLESCDYEARKIE